MKTINQQTPGPLFAPTRQAPSEVTVFRTFGDGAQHPCTLAVVTKHGSNQERDTNAALLAASYTAFDQSGRALGVDAVELARTIDLEEVIRYALDYAALHTAKTGDVGRPDQVKAAAQCLKGLGALLGMTNPHA